MGKVIVYSKASCGQCMFTKSLLDSLGVPYEERRTDLSDEVREEALATGLLGAPIVVAPSGEAIAGFNENWLRALAG